MTSPRNSTGTISMHASVGRVTLGWRNRTPPSGRIAYLQALGASRHPPSSPLTAESGIHEKDSIQGSAGSIKRFNWVYGRMFFSM